MLTLINTNLMQPVIAPIGLDYVACAARDAGIETHVVDLCLAENTDQALRAHFRRHSPDLVGLSIRNVDDSFWPSAQSFLTPLSALIRSVRSMTAAPVVLGGVGFSIFARRIVAWTGADYGICGDGETALVALCRDLSDPERLGNIPGLLSRTLSNRPAWDSALRVPTRRDAVDNAAYFRLGGQIGLETKRGCPAACDFCADPLAKGAAARLRPPADAADEAEALLRQGVDVLHLCDGEFNVPYAHARA
ncbi:MAG: cobalamin B12-binding domain-containing protein, partial [Planctomycetota bacterium]|nr:cobalamin B12-binding domain-containing protein [Planctomycetota bacterium]